MQKDLNEWVRTCTGKQGIQKVREKVAEKIRSIETFMEDIGEGTSINPEILKKLIVPVWQRQQLREMLEEFDGQLARVENSKRWRNADRDFVVYEKGVSRGKMRAVKIEAKTLVVTLDNKHGLETIRLTEDKAAVALFTARRDRTFVYETAVGVVYSDLRKPKFSVTTAAGSTVVVEEGEEPVGLSPTVMGNFVWRMSNSKSSLFPLLQIGLYVDKKSPALHKLGTGEGSKFRWAAQAQGLQSMP